VKKELKDELLKRWASGDYQPAKAVRETVKVYDSDAKKRRTTRRVTWEATR
jgi:hypothetical protein